MNIYTVTTEEQRQDAFKVRMEVFVEEQKVPEEEEIDEHENEAWHFVAYDEGEPVAAGRLRKVHDYGKVERICVRASHRKTGLGYKLMKHIEQLATDKNLDELHLHAQTQAEKFYEKLDYKTTSGLFYDAGIPHVEMVKAL
ncbi:GNAT family N-acetyltransferase [Texcoconibacillus texcoconensis]|uniref:N-acetyltransferase domain-containing protein n=1 Tax=Texcoconibacillus texcoconensis TaxID=1095777 RepID=A0A840QLM7_9BACI|nr:GNAT family N-acetyltransferase [Texcoconibacillus texcoconensis]MBB5172267.1 hypothetical protein [Texcoconibacillus texcoconensis]